MSKENKWSLHRKIKAPFGAALLTLPLAILPIISSNSPAVAASCGGRLVRTLNLGNGTVKIYSNGLQKCVITKANNTSTRKLMSAYIKGQAIDVGNYFSYAGPVYGTGRCVTWGGQIGRASAEATTCAL
jgi:hypothetical protein